jgi:hypothetical protein
MSMLNKKVLDVLEQTNYIACLCTITSKGVPSGRYVKVVPSKDRTKLYVGNRQLSGAVKDLEANPHAVFVVCDKYDDPVTAHSYQIDCTIDDHRIFSEDDPIFQYVAEATKDLLSRPESTFLMNLLKETPTENKTVIKELLDLANRLEQHGLTEVLSFTINQIIDRSFKPDESNYGLRV